MPPPDQKYFAIAAVTSATLMATSSIPPPPQTIDLDVFYGTCQSIAVAVCDSCSPIKSYRKAEQKCDIQVEGDVFKDFLLQVAKDLEDAEIKGNNQILLTYETYASKYGDRTYNEEVRTSRGKKIESYFNDIISSKGFGKSIEYNKNAGGIGTSVKSMRDQRATLHMTVSAQSKKENEIIGNIIRKNITRSEIKTVIKPQKVAATQEK